MPLLEIEKVLPILNKISIFGGLNDMQLISIFDCDKELFGLLILNIARETCRRLNKTDEILLHYFGDK